MALYQETQYLRIISYISMIATTVESYDQVIDICRKYHLELLVYVPSYCLSQPEWKLCQTIPYQI